MSAVSWLCLAWHQHESAPAVWGSSRAIVSFSVPTIQDLLPSLASHGGSAEALALGDVDRLRTDRLATERPQLQVMPLCDAAGHTYPSIMYLLLYSLHRFSCQRHVMCR